MQKNSTELWTVRPETDSYTFELLAECMADIASSVRHVNDEWVKERLTENSLKKAARDMSVAIRKIMLDDGGAVLKRCVTPRLHLLKKPPKVRKPDVLVENIGGMSVHYSLGESGPEKIAAAPPYEHKTLVSPLYGLRRLGKNQYRLSQAFDFSQQPTKMSRWLRQKVLQVDNSILTAESVLRLIANKEGAHIELNEMTRLNASTPIGLRLSDEKDELYRKGNWVSFGGISYLHVFTLHVGVYLLGMMKRMLKHLSSRQMDNRNLPNDSSTILRTPSHIPPLVLPLKKQFGIGVVFHDTGDVENPIRLVEESRSAGITSIHIPN